VELKNNGGERQREAGKCELKRMGRKGERAKWRWGEWVKNERMKK